MLELKHITKNYKIKNGIVLALNDINYRFKNNGMYFILGKSGSGKTTILNIIGGLDNVTNGEIYIDDKKINILSNKELDNYRNNYVGFIFQEYNLIDELNVYDNVSLALNLQGKKIIKIK